MNEDTNSMVTNESEPGLETPGNSPEAPQERQTGGYVTMSGSRKENLMSAIQEAHILIRYLSQRGMKVPDDTLASIIIATNKINTEELNTTEEVAFWKASSKLAHSVAPVTLKSIEATQPAPGKRGKQSIASRETRQFSLITVLLLVVLVVVQVYWVILNNLVSDIQFRVQDIQKVEENINKLHIKWSDMMRKRIDAAIDKDSLPLGGKEGLKGKGISTDTVKQAGEGTTLGEYDPSNESPRTPEENAVSFELKTAIIEVRLLWKELNAKADMLGWWLFNLNPITKVVKPEQGESEVEEREQKKEDLTDAWARVEKKIDELWNVTVVYLEQKDVEQITIARQILLTMSSYILPMLYGLLGAAAYILRSLTRAIEAITFTKASVTQYWLRLPLGMLSGIAVGWFFKAAGETAGLASLQPIALAFIAGYSVELIFTAMDRLIGAFATNESRPGREPTER